MSTLFGNRYGADSPATQARAAHIRSEINTIEDHAAAYGQGFAATVRPFVQDQLVLENQGAGTQDAFIGSLKEWIHNEQIIANTQPEKGWVYGGRATKALARRALIDGLLGFRPHNDAVEVSDMEWGLVEESILDHAGGEPRPTRKQAGQHDLIRVYSAKELASHMAYWHSLGAGLRLSGLVEQLHMHIPTLQELERPERPMQLEQPPRPERSAQSERHTTLERPAQSQQPEQQETHE